MLMGPNVNYYFIKLLLMWEFIALFCFLIIDNLKYYEHIGTFFNTCVNVTGKNKISQFSDYVRDCTMNLGVNIFV